MRREHAQHARAARLGTVADRPKSARALPARVHREAANPISRLTRRVSRDYAAPRYVFLTSSFCFSFFASSASAIFPVSST
jgi:hypothetical protein